MSELEKIKVNENGNENKNLIVCFGGLALQMGGILPFEFLNYLSLTYTDGVDFLFYIDKNQRWYHKGIQGISTNICDTIHYLNKKISKKKYEKIIFMGTSMGGYASILFGSLCNNVDHVISFTPQTILKNPENEYYKDLKLVINPETKYILYGDSNICDSNDLYDILYGDKDICDSKHHHHIYHCKNLANFPNVKLVEKQNIDLKKLRDNGEIKQLLDSLLFTEE